MKKEVVEDFLNLPGIAGVALMDRRSRPYFCGVDHTLNFQQKEALAQGIRQVVETTPEGFESFEFQFTGHQVYIYKLAEGMILLVLTTQELIAADYLSALTELKTALEADVNTAIATFRLLAGSVTLSNQSYWRASSLAGRETSNWVNTSLNQGTETVSPDFANPQSSNNGAISVEPPLVIPVESVNPHSPPSECVTLKELLAALNHLSQFTTQYLGTAVIYNYWKSSRPEQAWLQPFQINRNAEISYSGSLTYASTIEPEEIQWVKGWVQAFIERCTKVIRDFPVLVEQTALDPHQKQILLP